MNNDVAAGIRTPEPLTMIELKTMKLECDAISACNIFSFDNNLDIRKLGSKALRLYNETISDDLDQLEILREGVSDWSNPEDEKVKEYRKREKEVYQKKAPFEFDIVKISASAEQRESWNTSFPQVKTIGLGGQHFDVYPYSAFLDLIIKNFITVTSK